MAVQEAKLRADAQANREHLLDVARAALAADPAVSLNAIAKTAGLGPGTLYRHFPNREALVVGVYRKEMDDLVARAPVLLAENPPLEAFRRWCIRLAKSGRTKYAITALLEGALTDEDTHETYVRVVSAAQQLMDACTRCGDIKPGLDAEDFLTLVSFLWKLPPNSTRAKKLLAFVFGALTEKA